MRVKAPVQKFIARSRVKTLRRLIRLLRERAAREADKSREYMAVFWFFRILFKLIEGGLL
jgi:hypothetical protein